MLINLLKTCFKKLKKSSQGVYGISIDCSYYKPLGSTENPLKFEIIGAEAYSD